MKITKIIYICFGIPVVIAILLTSLVIFHSSRANQAAEIRQIALDINSAASELDFIAYEYFLNKEDRMEQQWQLSYDSALLLLQRAAFSNIEETELMPPAFADLYRLFMRLIENNKEMERLIQDSAPQAVITAIVVLEETLASSLRQQAQAIMTNTFVLAETAYNRSNRAQITSRNLAIASMVSITITAFIAALIIVRMITRPLNKLNNYAKNISEGNYDAQIKNNHSNEIGNVASTVKNMVKQLLAAQHKLVLSEKLATIGQLASGVAHDLRNPLGVINNSVHLLKLKLSNTDEKTHRYFELMEKAVLRSSNVIEGLLDLARTKEPILKEVNVNLLTAEVIDTINTPDNVKLIVGQDDDLPKMAADASQIERVFNNLINNAVQAMPDGGTLTITSSHNEKMITTKFRDTGKGIEEENLVKIFEPLFTTKTGTGGSGIGLSISKTIIEAHRGSIKVKSEVGKGTTFTVKLPNYVNEN